MKDFFKSKDSYFRKCYHAPKAEQHYHYSGSNFKENVRTWESYVMRMPDHTPMVWQITNEKKQFVSEIEMQFNRYAEKWKEQTGLFSTTFHKVANDSYLDIIGMGREVIPFILKDIQNGGTAHWHNALKALTKENPVPDEDLNKNKKVKEAWLNWGTKKSLI